MIELYQFPPMWGLPNFSPFCLKLETWLRMAKLPYQAPKCGIPLGKAPKHKLPYIVDRGQSIGDSSLIIDHLKATYGDTLDNGLSPQQQAVSLAFQRLIEENLYWPVLYSRWLDPRNRQVIARKVFGRLPPLIRDLVPMLVRRKMRRDMQGQGLGRHSEGEIYAIGCRDLDAVALFLDGDSGYWTLPAGFMVDRLGAMRTCRIAFGLYALWPIALMLAGGPSSLAVASAIFGVSSSSSSSLAGSNCSTIRSSRSPVPWPW